MAETARQARPERVAPTVRTVPVTRPGDSDPNMDEALRRVRTKQVTR
ncbi:hypothetical protein ABZU94_14050 [Streptomyces mirabilis]